MNDAMSAKSMRKSHFTLIELLVSTYCLYPRKLV